jgi:hypothetical protein
VYWMPCIMIAQGKKTPNGLRYWRWGGRGLCLGAEKTQSLSIFTL